MGPQKWLLLPDSDTKQKQNIQLEKKKKILDFFCLENTDFKFDQGVKQEI